MASEYLKWLARNEKPEPKRELTPKEKWNNWWDYHKWHVVIAILAVLFVVLVIRDIVSSRSNEPDYQVAYIGSVYLPDDTAAALSSALSELGADLNGDGQVKVQINQYPIFSENIDYSIGMAAKVHMTADSESFFFLMEDPAQFQEQYGVLSHPDGTLPEEDAAPSQDLWLSWSECPVLTRLSLGSYTIDSVEDPVTGDSQELLSTLYIGRRGFEENAKFKNLEGCTVLWQKMIEGAN